MPEKQSETRAAGDRQRAEAGARGSSRKRSRNEAEAKGLRPDAASPPRRLAALWPDSTLGKFPPAIDCNSETATGTSRLHFSQITLGCLDSLPRRPSAPPSRRFHPSTVVLSTFLRDISPTATWQLWQRLACTQQLPDGSLLSFTVPSVAHTLLCAGEP